MQIPLETISKEFKKLDGILKDARIVSLFLQHNLPDNQSAVKLNRQVHGALRELNNAISIWSYGDDDANSS